MSPAGIEAFPRTPVLIPTQRMADRSAQSASAQRIKAERRGKGRQFWSCRGRLQSSSSDTWGGMVSSLQGLRLGTLTGPPNGGGSWFCRGMRGPDSIPGVAEKRAEVVTANARHSPVRAFCVPDELASGVHPLVSSPESCGVGVVFMPILQVRKWAQRVRGLPEAERLLTRGAGSWTEACLNPDLGHTDDRCRVQGRHCYATRVWLSPELAHSPAWEPRLEVSPQFTDEEGEVCLRSACCIQLPPTAASSLAGRACPPSLR